MEVARSNRFHIGFFGPCNAGKSSLLNALVGQDEAIVSDTAGTTTDVVKKNMEISGVGPDMTIRANWDFAVWTKPVRKPPVWIWPFWY